MNQLTIVFAIIMLVWIGIFGYIVSLDSRLRKLEKDK